MTTATAVGYGDRLVQTVHTRTHTLRYYYTEAGATAGAASFGGDVTKIADTRWCVAVAR